MLFFTSNLKSDLQLTIIALLIIAGSFSEILRTLLVNYRQLSAFQFWIAISGLTILAVLFLLIFFTYKDNSREGKENKKKGTKKQGPFKLKLFITSITSFIIVIIGSFIVQKEACKCAYNKSEDTQTIIEIIRAEAKAVVNEDPDIIRSIFSENAIIKNAASNEVWSNPMTWYITLFANNDFIEADNYEIQPCEISISGNCACFTSKSKGRLITSNNEIIIYDDTTAHCLWNLSKNSCGCWEITSFTFNLH